MINLDLTNVENENNKKSDNLDLDFELLSNGSKRWESEEVIKYKSEIREVMESIF